MGKCGANVTPAYKDAGYTFGLAPGWLTSNKTMTIYIWRSMRPDPSRLDAEIAELRYRIRAISQLLSEQGDMLTDLRDNINFCLEHEPEEARTKKCCELLDTVTSLTKDSNKRAVELQKLLAEYLRLTKERRDLPIKK